MSGLLLALALTAENALVVITPKACEATRFAAVEMTNALAHVFGREVAVATAPAEGKVNLVLGTNRWSAAAGLAPWKLPRDAFEIRHSGDSVYIAGCDDPKSRVMLNIFGNGRGTMVAEHATAFGVYEFLERFAGARFFYPGELGTVFPKARRLEIPDALALTGKPDSATRKNYTHRADGVWFEETPYQGKRLNWMRLRLETETIPCCHGTRRFRIIDRFAESNPEYFAMRRDGSRWNVKIPTNPHSLDGQLCFSSGVRDVIAADTIERMKKGERYVDIMPNDAYPGCFCEKCRGRSTGDIVWEYTNYVADKVKAAGLDGCYVTQMAYSSYVKVPSFPLRDNILVMVAQNGPWSRFETGAWERQHAAFAAWKEKLGHRVWAWTYPGKHSSGGLKIDNIPQMTPRAYGEYYPKMSDVIFGAFAESESDRWFYNHLNYYIFGKVMWNNKADVAALLDDYYRTMYGPAADEVRKFFEELEEMWLTKITARTVVTDLGPKCFPPDVDRLWRGIYTREKIDGWKNLLRGAAKKLDRGSLEARRLALVCREMLRPMDEASAKYLESSSVEGELKRRAAHPEEKSIITNCDFTEKPRGRFFGGWYANEPPAPLDHKVSVTGGVSVKLTGGEKAVNVAQYLPELRGGRRYRLSFFIKTENIVGSTKGAGAGITFMDIANRSFPDRISYSGTMDWTHCSFEFTAREGSNEGKKSYIRLRISANTTGTAWFDGVRLVPLD